MIISTSYFYRIREFLPNMIPVSTAISDPKWYHENKDKNHIFYDKRGIINGIRFEYFIIQRNMQPYCPCLIEEPTECEFLKRYKQELDKLDFDYVMERLSSLGQYFKAKNKFKGEPHIALLVHEAYYNPCSERKMIQKYFQEHGVNCQELKYLIKENYK